MTDFTKMTPIEIARFAKDHRGDMAADGIEASDVTEAIQSGRAKLEVRPYGFALVQVAPASDGRLVPHLWLLYVDEDKRGKRVGHKLMRELLSKYCNDYHMSLYCEGPRRRAFFGRLGFRVESRDGDMRRMTTNPDRR